MHRLIVVALLCGTVSGGAVEVRAAAPDPTAPDASATITSGELLAGFAAIPGLEAEYREEKHMALLAAPLVSKGRLHFAPPGKLVRHQLSPAKSTVLIDGAKLSFGDAHGKQSIDLAAKPVVRLFVDSFVKILAGDRAALDKIYDMSFSSEAGLKWTMRLQPKVAPMTKLIDRVELRGVGQTVAEMKVIEIGGDVTVTTFTNVDSARKYSKVELRALFRLPG